MKLITIVGARPQFIKAAAVSREISKREELREIIIHTGQHYDKNMSDIFFQEMKIPSPHYNLHVSKGLHGASTGLMLEKIEEVLLKEKPDAVIVYGDTNSTLAGALAAKKIHIKLIHVEAGLRSFEMKMPEEINRILTDRISDILFCPTVTAVNNLKQEGFENFNCRVIKNGDVMQDAAIYYENISDATSSITQQLNLKDFVLATIHRAENTDSIQNLKSVIHALNQINKTIKVILPLHPRTKKALDASDIKVNFTIIEPVGYLDMIQLIKHSSLILTDSGGLQKEAFFFKKNCVTLRNETEWIELIENGFNILAGTDSEKILQCFSQMLGKKSDFNIDLYGNGKASKIIADELLKL
ncbi:MAG: UDP-N-acetylglucosamine 2-epimerase (non-hydrolyzing) [Cytophagaceae bacterium]|nr:UDP-N-acetylglucosamine 2-epimerase (non-hydrolyzing) [Cytophagaceae bacterium]